MEYLVGQRSADVIWMEPRVFAQNLALRNPLRQHATRHDQLDRYPSPSDHGFAHHGLGFYANTIPDLFFHPRLPALTHNQATCAQYTTQME